MHEVLAFSHVLIDDPDEGQDVFRLNHMLRDTDWMNTFFLELLKVLLAKSSLLWRQELDQESQTCPVVDDHA